MAANPFYIDPFGGYGEQITQGLTGLGAVLGERQQMKREQEKRKILGQEATRLIREGTPDQVYQFSLENPEFSQIIDNRMGYLNKESRENAFQTAMRIAQGENPIEAYGQRLQYLESIGANPAETQRELETAMSQYAENPEGYRAMVANTVPLMFRNEYGQYATAMGAGKQDLTATQKEYQSAKAEGFEGTFLDYQKALKEAGRAGADTSSSNIREFELAKSEGFQGSFLDFVNQRAGRGEGIELSPFAEKQLSAATTEAVEASNNVVKFNDLADEIEAADFGGGLLGGSWKEKFKDITGEQDAVTQLRRRFNAVKASNIVKNLPPGAASDADIAMAQSGFPTDNYNSKQLAEFLRFMSRMEAAQAKFADFKANYISENKTESGLLKAWKKEVGIEDGKGGASKGSTQPTAPVGNRSYMRYGQ